MNGTSFLIIVLLVAVLIAGLFGANVYEQQQQARYDELVAQRNQLLNLANEAKVQRDVKGEALDKAVQEAAALQESLDQKVQEVSSLNEQLAAEKNASQSLQAQVDDLNTQIADQQQQVASVLKEADALKAEAETRQAEYDALNERYQALEKEYTALSNIIPVTSGAEKADKGLYQASPVAAEQPNRLGVGLVVMLGMVVLSSGGYVAYASNPNHKVTVKMTREQIKEYARFQRQQHQ